MKRFVIPRTAHCDDGCCIKEWEKISPTPFFMLKISVYEK